MRLLLDTNFLLEVTKLRPAECVLSWLDVLDEDRTFISIVSIAEIRRSVALMEIWRKRDALDTWLTHDLPQRLDKRIIPVEAHVALAWGDLTALAKRSGRGLHNRRSGRGHRRRSRFDACDTQDEGFRRLRNRPR